MKIRINNITINNFRGINSAQLSFSDVNFLVGNNGTGKTTCLAAIARLLPILRNEERIFLDGDFLFVNDEQAKTIEITYDFDITTEDSVRTVNLCVKGNRVGTGKTRSQLNDQAIGIVTSDLSDEIKHIVTEQIEKKPLTQRVIRNGWGGGRICPISLNTDEDQRQKHAATSTKEESGAFDGLRARLVQRLRGTDLGNVVEQDHPNLLKNVLNFTNQFIGENRFRDIKVGFSEILNLVRWDNCVQPWDGLSGGEQSAFNLAMSIEFSKMLNSQLLIIEEPETTLHPTIQRNFISVIRECLPDCQIFLSTHSPYVFENYLNGSSLIVGKKSLNNGIYLHNPSAQQWLFSSVSWGELSYYAYDLATFEYHNELYGWIQERTENWTENQIETYFTQNGFSQKKVWIRLRNGQRTSSNCTIMTYIRDFTHHPENTNNKEFTESELRDSISNMRNIVHNII
jgi:ABC-type Mn2+/Zn2+ transport system ATPase subunit